MGWNNWGRWASAALLAWCATCDVASSATYDEAVDGDLSNVPASPTPWTLTAGANRLTGVAGTNPDTGVTDYDLIALEVPAGHQLDSITILSYSNPDIYAMSFFGMQPGSPWLDGLGFDIVGHSLLGWAHVQNQMGGMDLLPMIQDHANPPGFDIPLPAGVYTMLIEDVDTTISYSLQYNVSAVPEPACGALATMAMLGIGCVRRRQRRWQAATIA